jgi:glycosyltransferase involved in cell wall biosynthesis
MAEPEARPPTLTLPWEGRRVAIAHDWFQGFHGSERVVHVMKNEVFDRASQVDVLTFHAARELLPPDLAESIVRESRLSRLPGLRQRGREPGLWRYLLPYMPIYFARLPLDDYDLVVSSSHACAVNVRPREDATHVCYCYSPIRYVWMPETDGERVSGARGAGLRAVTSWLRHRDARASKRVDSYVAISEAVRQRIGSFYERDATVIHPPVDIDAFSPADKDPTSFLWVHRLVPYKRPEVVMEAFRGLPCQLTMVGVGPLEQRLRSQLPPNVQLRGWIDREELAELYSRAAGFIHVGEEDFGISMVEALAAGTPVIAVDAGGARDIVRHGIDGLLIAEPTVAGVRAAVGELRERDWDTATLAERAERFSRARFVRELTDHIASLAK